MIKSAAGADGWDDGGASVAADAGRPATAEHHDFWVAD